MPALVCRTSSQALSRTILPYVLKVAEISSDQKLKEDLELFTAINVMGGKIIHPGIILTSD
jgi:alanine dehydrogenase